MSEHRKGLDLSKLISKPEPAPRREGAAPPSAPAAAVPQPPKGEGQGGWPSREAAPRDVQLNIRLPEDVSERFKEIAYRLRRNHAKTLEFLLDSYERSQDEQG